MRIFLRLALLLVLQIGCSAISELEHSEEISLHDSRLQIALFAADPDIVTPIGMAVDEQERVFVVESHTHSPPAEYPGPESDIIKVFIDEDDDGRSDRFHEFARGLDAAMNLAFSPGGILYVVCAREVVALYDRDGDGAADSRKQILQMETSERYPHNCLLSLAFSNDGWLYIGRGNTAGKQYTLRGTDGSTISGYGDGGSIVRVRPDGSELEEFATGFWNPFALFFDRQGRLLCADNDPDARGPNRLIHIVQHGDYGYKSLYGYGGNHPFQGWDGRMPGVLPMIAGTGEAPSGLMDANQAALPRDYRDNLLVTIWNENRVDRFQTSPAGVSVQASGSPLISGPQDFRPVALATGPSGHFYLTDWVLVDYPNHGRGKIWRVSTRPGVPVDSPRPPYTAHDRNRAFEPFERLFAGREPDTFSRAIAALKGEDAFLHHSAVVALSRAALLPRTLDLVEAPDRRVRLGALLALRRSNLKDRESTMRRFLSDPDPEVRRMALIWVGEEMKTSLREEVLRTVASGEITPLLFETYLAALENLDPAFVRAFHDQTKESSQNIPRRFEPEFVRSLIRDPARPVTVRQLAVRHLKDLEDSVTLDLLLQAARREDLPVRLEAVRSLSRASGEEVRGTLMDLAADPNNESSVRVQALVSLSWQPHVPPDALKKLLGDRDAEVQIEAARTLRHHSRKAAESAVRPRTFSEWQEALAAGGDVDRGRRVFYSALSTCSSCHTIGGHGGLLGPDLTNVSQSLSRQQIVHSILRPSDQFPPEYQAWVVRTRDGRIHTGLQLDHKQGGAIEIFTTAGEWARFEASEIESYRVTTQSLMPDGLEANLTVEELKDLVAFLRSTDSHGSQN